jgi:hypothetical protein
LLPDPWAGSELLDEDPELVSADGVVLLEHAATVTATATTTVSRISVGTVAALIRTIARPLSSASRSYLLGRPAVGRLPSRSAPSWPWRIAGWYRMGRRWCDDPSDTAFDFTQGASRKRCRSR